MELKLNHIIFVILKCFLLCFILPKTLETLWCCLLSDTWFQVYMISPSTTCSWIKIFVDPGTTFQSTNQIWGTSLQFMSSLGLNSGLGASTSELFTYHLPMILGITYGLGNIFRQDFCSKINKICWSRNMFYLEKSQWPDINIFCNVVAELGLQLLIISVNVYSTEFSIDKKM